MKIVVTEPHMMAESVKASLGRLGTVVLGPFDDAALREELTECEALMVRIGRRIDKDFLLCAPKLRYVISATTGLDHIDLSATGASGVSVISLRDCPEEIVDVSATAEHSWGLLLALARRTYRAAEHVLSGGWDRNLFWGTQLKGKRLGIVGYGRIGAMIASYGNAFDMDVVAYDTQPAKIVAPAKPLPLDELVRTSDAISVHVTAAPENWHLFDENLIAKMKHGAVLVNTTRGSIVDETALAGAVFSGRLGGVAVDVLDGEEHHQIEMSPLISCARAGQNVLITPHIGGAAQDAIARTEAAVVACFAHNLHVESFRQ